MKINVFLYIVILIIATFIIVLLFMIFSHLEIIELKLDTNYSYQVNYMGILLSCGVTILGLFLVVFIYLFTIIRPNILQIDYEKNKNDRLFISYKIANYIYPFGFISFIIFAFPISVLAVFLLFNGINSVSFSIILLSPILYAMAIILFQKAEKNKIISFWKLHRQFYHKKIIYYLINSINSILAFSVIRFFKPIYTFSENNGFTSLSYITFFMMFYLIALWCAIYFLLQNASYVFVISTEYLIHENKEIKQLNKELSRLAKRDLKLIKNIEEKWKYLIIKKGVDSNLDIKSLRKDIEDLKKIT